jgi:hypothetical protein
MMRDKRSREFLFVALLLTALGGSSGCGGINRLPTLDEQVKAAWSEVLNQYQRRADLIPNLVETVKGYAHQEQQRRIASAHQSIARMKEGIPFSQASLAFVRCSWSRGGKVEDERQIIFLLQTGLFPGSNFD